MMSADHKETLSYLLSVLHYPQAPPPKLNMNEMYFTNVFYSFNILAKYHIQIYDSILKCKKGYKLI